MSSDFVPPAKGLGEVICTCTKCSKKKAAINNGQFISGKWVSRNTRIKHTRKETEPSNLDVDPDMPDSEKSSQPLELLVDFSSIERFCCMLVLWLHLKAGRYTYIAGLTPSPKQPAVRELPHLIDPVVDAILQTEDANAAPIKTHYRPDGVHVPTRIIPLLADLGGAREAGGFLSHKANCFCSYCKLLRANKDNLDIQSWTKRTMEEVREQAKQWRDAKTIKDRTALERKFGVRWCSFHRTSYWDPVRHIILGFLHNWLEGVLQHQLRQLWGIGRKEVAEDKDEQFTLTDVEESADEISELESDSDNSDNLDSEDESDSDHSTPRATPVPDSGSTQGTPAPDSEHSTPRATPAPDSSSTPQGTPAPDVVPPGLRRGPSRKSRPSVFPPDSGSTSRGQKAKSKSKSKSSTILSMLVDEQKEDKDADYKAPIEYSFDFSKTELTAIREGIRDISLPTWVGRPPTNLGEKSHGKLKADTFLNLFTVIFPLLLPAIFLERGDERSLSSFYDLTAATNILVAFKTSNSEAQAYTAHYTAYRQSKHKLYPEFEDVPNHHFAMHNGELLMYWGPLACLSDFAGERMNGRLQKVKTNKHMYDMDFTMLQQMTRLCRFLAFLEHNASSIPEMDVFADILQPEHATKGPTTQAISDSEQATYMKTKATALDTTTYNMILQYLNKTGHHGQYHSHLNYVHLYALVLPPLAKKCSEFHENGHTYSCNSSHEGNSFIQFYDQQIQGHRTGVINNIFEIPLQGNLQKFILVSPHCDLNQSELKGTPYDPMLYPRFMSKIVEVELSEDIVVIEPKHIITHLTTYKTQGDIYGIEREIRVQVESTPSPPLHYFA
ncbi:hypothetical protein K438DRAFT_1777567 [Mycena galopus ATCC 62051]|nr:hypothetical protein K438DRAFT_1777567 [Mycena galopus ATCC 62051]